MARGIARLVLVAGLAVGLFAGTAGNAQGQTSEEGPYSFWHNYDFGSTRFSVSNTGYYGGGGNDNPGGFGGLWIGAVRDGDTLVTAGADGMNFTGFEFFPATRSAQEEFGELPRIRSIYDTTSDDAANAHSAEDVWFTYYDTLVVDESYNDYDLRPHRPLNLRIEQTTYGWNQGTIDAFKLCDYAITNLSVKTLKNAFIGVFFDPSSEGSGVLGGTGSGSMVFLPSAKTPVVAPFRCDILDQIDLLWTAHGKGFTQTPNGISLHKGVSAIKILRPSTGNGLSFNWWITSFSDDVRDFGPRKISERERPFMPGDFGTPLGDRNKYHLLSNGTIDYDQLYTAVDHYSAGWRPPRSDARDIADGSYDHHCLLSVGPIDIFPGQTIPFTFAFLTAPDFHRDTSAFSRLWDPLNPDPFYNQLNFDPLVRSAYWASWVYDNPGVDTDSDGYAGRYSLCEREDSLIFDTTLIIDSSVLPFDTIFVIDSTFSFVVDTFYFEGDGVPDFRGTAPPSPPIPRVFTSEGQMIFEWNGLASETTKDVVSGVKDFEGYRVYRAFEKRRAAMELLSSYDREDYTQHYLEFQRNTFDSGWVWRVLRAPFSLREIQIAYAGGNSSYHPLTNGIANPLISHDSTFYFSAQDFNQSNLADTMGIHKIYPSAPYPHTLDTALAFHADTLYRDPRTGRTTFYAGGELTPDGLRFKHFEYRFVARNLNPGPEYFMAVTAFDYGIQEQGVPALETNPLVASLSAFPHPPADTNSQTPLDVIVYPNPWRIDGDYRDDGYSGRGLSYQTDERTRVIHFTHLPPECDITIYSLDGDLIRTIEHHRPATAPDAMHDSWDVITRNRQVPTSGLYYFVVTAKDGRKQVGKLVIIM